MSTPSLGSLGVVDGHNDLAIAMRNRYGYDLDRVDLGQRQPPGTLRTDIPRLREGGVGAQFWSVYVPARLAGEAAVVATLEQIDFVYDLVGRFPEDLVVATSVAEVRRARQEGRIACLLGAEGGHQIAGSTGVLRMYHRLGVRYLTLTHNDNTPWADSATDEEALGGLSDFGVEVVREMNRLGILVDLSHVSVGTMRAAVAASESPVIFSHSSAHALCRHPRNVPDDVIASVGAGGGVVMVALVPEFLDQDAADWDLALRGELARSAGGATVVDRRRVRADFEAEHGPSPVATVAQAADHVEHIREVAGVDHIGVGGDYEGVAAHPKGLEDVSGYPALWEELAGRGWSATDIDKVAGENILRTLGQAEAVAARLSAAAGPSRARLGDL